MKHIIDKLYSEGRVSSGEYIKLLNLSEKDDREYLYEMARSRALDNYGKCIYIRGLIEFTNYCANDCYYCGIRCSNNKASRYRLTKEQILECCYLGYELGFRTFVLQGGEDFSYSRSDMIDIISSIKKSFKDCAITLSIGEREYDEYKAYFDAGANRYLLRHETANEEHYRSLHPSRLSLEHRKQCLYNLKSIGYQVGTGIMVGSPYQKDEYIVEDLEFMMDLQPDMIGIGPYISHIDTPFAKESNGSVIKTLNLIAILRLTFPYALIPATTSLGTLDNMGREKGILAGANVLMPNLSPVDVRKKYMLYDNKICTGEEAAQCIGCLQKRVQGIGYEIVSNIGDVISH